jgi:hypothetical protein
MRKALIGFFLAAAVMAPAAAEAQRGHRDGGGDRGSHSRGNGDGGNRNGGESRAARIEARNEARSQNAQPQQPQQAQQPRAQVAQSPRGDGGNRGGNRGGGWNRGNDNNNGGNRGGWNRGGGDGNRGRRDQPSIYPQAWQGNPNDPRLQHYRELERRNQNGGYDRGGRGERDGRNWRNGRNGQDSRRGDRNRNWRNDWNRGWRNDNRYNWSSWRSRNRHAYHLSPYYSPYRNWRYQRFSVGLFLDSLFYSQRYWIGDPWQYRLPAAPYGTQWVRYYNDVLLVDVYTGEVVDVIYDFFW